MVELVFARQERPAGLSTLEQVRALQEQAAAAAETAAADAVAAAQPGIQQAAQTAADSAVAAAGEQIAQDRQAAQDAAGQAAQAAQTAAQDAAAAVATEAADAIRAQVAADADRAATAAGAATGVVRDVQVETMPAVIPVAKAEPLVVTSDGYQLIRREGSSLFVGDAQFDMDGVTGDLRITTPDGYSLLSFDPQTGGIRGAIAPDHLTITGGLNLINGTPCPGTVTKVRRSGEFFGYDLDGPDYTGPVIGRVTGDWAAPHFADSPVIDVIEADGQSWQTAPDHYPDEIDVEDPSGETSATLRNLLSPMVMSLRASSAVGIQYPQDDLTGRDRTFSDGQLPGEFYRFAPRLGFSTSQMAAVVRSRLQRRMGIASNPAVVFHVGHPGQNGDKFLPEGTSFSYVDDSGATQTVNASLVDGQTVYLWAMNLSSRQAIMDFVAARYLNRTLRFRFLTWIQGTYNNFNQAMAFAAKFREEQDKLGLGVRDILWDQFNGTTSSRFKSKGIQAQVEFAQINASGHDWLVGPRYQYRIRDEIHHSSFGALQYAEAMGQAMAYIEKYGEWEPLWVENYSVSGNTLTLTTNRPRQAVGDLVIDTDTIPAQPNHGFLLRDVAADADIPITSVSVSGTAITITAATPLSGQVEVCYASISAATVPRGTVTAPQFPATVGNIRMTGRDAPAVIPASVQPRMDAWLCAVRKIITA